jgi:SagB-type dehydrogenase family enzyme
MNAYVATMEVEGLPPGLYHYDPGRHALAEIRRANLRGDLGGALVERSNADAAAMLFLTASFWRCRFKYGLRGYRFALLEAGHIAQNAILAAAALDVAALPIGGYFDRRIDGLLDIDGLHESTIYLIALGPRRAETRA